MELSLNPDNIKELSEKYSEAVQNEQTSFFWIDHEVATEYAKWLLEYIQQNNLENGTETNGLPDIIDY